MKGDRTLVEVLRALLNCVIFSRANYQRYLEALGPGGTGKGTFFRLASALVGENNVMATTLKQLEENRFEVGAFRNIKLLLITEAEKHGGDVNILKALTGEDKVRSEVKGRQRKSKDDFYFKGFIFVSANEAPQSADYTSGLERRRLSVPFTHQTPAEKRRDLGEEFKPYLAGLLEWVLAMPGTEVRSLVVSTEKSVPSLAKIRGESICDANPIADWLDNCIVLNPDEKTYVGVDDFERAHQWLYAHYANFTRKTNGRVIGQRRFTKLLCDLCENQLKFPDVKWGRDRHGSHFWGLRIRVDSDTAPRPITGQEPPEPPDIPPNGSGSGGNSPSGSPPVTANVMDCDGLVMAETLDSDGCDGCDAFFKKEDAQTELTSADDRSDVAASTPLVANFAEERDLRRVSVTQAESVAVIESQPSQPSVTIHHNPSHPSSQPPAICFRDIIAKTDVELDRLGWTKQQGREYLMRTYRKRSRQLLLDEELLDFLAYLESQPTPEPDAPMTELAHLEVAVGEEVDLFC